MVEQGHLHGVPHQHQQMYDPRAIEQMRHHPGYPHQQGPFPYPQEPARDQSGEYSKQTIMSDFETARQMRHPSPTEHKDMRQHRDPRDPSISPRAPEHPSQGPSPTQKGYYDPRGYPIPGPGGTMYMAPGHPGQGQQPPSSSR